MTSTEPTPTIHGHLSELLAHLLRWHAQPAERSPEWRATIHQKREEIRELIDNGAAAADYSPEAVDRAYEAAVGSLADGVDLGRTGMLRDGSPYTIHELLDRDFLPEMR